MLQHILFDLDETLYSRTSELMPAVRDRMLGYIMDRLALDEAHAHDLQFTYFRRYGTTLRGLQFEHGLDPYDFLSYVHDVPHAEYLFRDERLRATLERIPQPKSIFTNADVRHAEKTLAALGIRDLFQNIFDIVFFQWDCKPFPQAYERTLQALGIEPQECALVDDMASNIDAARAIGMRTVLLGAQGEADACIGEIYEVADALRAL